MFGQGSYQESRAISEVYEKIGRRYAHDSTASGGIALIAEVGDLRDEVLALRKAVRELTHAVNNLQMSKV